MRNNEKPSDLSDFDGWRRYLRNLILAARRREQKHDYVPLIESEWGAARFYIYDYYRRLSQANEMDALVDYLGPKTGPYGKRSGHILRLIDRPSDLLHRSKKSRIARDLEFALSFDINPKLVLGFLSEVGSQKAIFDSYKNDRHHEAADRYSI